MHILIKLIYNWINVVPTMYHVSAPLLMGNIVKLRFLEYKL